MKNTRGIAQRLGADSPQGVKNGGTFLKDHAARRTKHTKKTLIHVREVVTLAENPLIEHRGHLYE